MVSLVRDMAGDHPARPVLVLSNTPDATGLSKAKDLGVETAVVNHRDFDTRPAFEAVLNDTLDQVSPDIICHAGFMRILTATYMDRWQGRVLNIHPSLLPKYPGLNTHARALEAGDDIAGCTVHEATIDLDAGPILGQAIVPIQPGDTPKELAARVLRKEHQLYPYVLRRFASGDKTRADLPA
jgi:phosphoribosylglycinamide formyltransferase-1